MEENQGSSGTPSAEASGSEQEKNTVAYETYRKTVGEVKKLRSELEAERAKEVERQQTLLAEQGKYKEALESTLKKQKELEVKLADKDKSYARTIFMKEARSVALQMGAMPEAVDDIVKVGNWADVTIDNETFQVDQEQLKSALERLQKDKPFYFQKNPQAPNTIKGVKANVGTNKTLDELSKDEILAKLKTLGG